MHCGCKVKRCVNGAGGGSGNGAGGGAGGHGEGGGCRDDDVCVWNVARGRETRMAIKKRDCMSQVAICLGKGDGGKRGQGDRKGGQGDEGNVGQRNGGQKCGWHIAPLKCTEYPDNEEEP